MFDCEKEREEKEKEKREATCFIIYSFRFFFMTDGRLLRYSSAIGRELFDVNHP